MRMGIQCDWKRQMCRLHMYMHCRGLEKLTKTTSYFLLNEHFTIVQKMVTILKTLDFPGLRGFLRVHVNRCWFVEFSWKTLGVKVVYIRSPGWHHAFYDKQFCFVLFIMLSFSTNIISLTNMVFVAKNSKQWFLNSILFGFIGAPKSVHQSLFWVFGDLFIGIGTHLCQLSQQENKSNGILIDILVCHTISIFLVDNE